MARLRYDAFLEWLSCILVEIWPCGSLAFEDRPDFKPLEARHNPRPQDGECSPATYDCRSPCAFTAGCQFQK
jgi:hypothetical protein